MGSFEVLEIMETLSLWLYGLGVWCMVCQRLDGWQGLVKGWVSFELPGGAD